MNGYETDPRLDASCGAAPDEECEDVAPTRREVAVLQQAIDRARVCGLRLALGSWELAWFRGGHPQRFGCTIIRHRPILVYLRAGLPDQQLFKTILHELQHVRDADLQLSREQLEFRAERFEAFATSPDFQMVSGGGGDETCSTAGVIKPPSQGDILHVGRSCQWPAIPRAGLRSGEAAWRQAVEAAARSGRLLEIWHGIQAAA